MLRNFGAVQGFSKEMGWRDFLRQHPGVKWVTLAVLLALIGSGAAMLQLMGKPALQPVLTPVERGDVVDTVEATGTVDAVTTVNVGAQVSGMVDRIAVDFNTAVRKGQLLAHIESSQLEAAVKQARANVQAARAGVGIAATGVETAGEDLNVARANQARDTALARQAKVDYDRAQGLFDTQAGSQEARDRARSAWEAADAVVKAARAAVEQAQSKVHAAEAQLAQARAVESQAQAALRQAETNLSYATITSPIDGVVVARNIDVGQTVASRLSAPNLFNIAEDLQEMYVYTKLDVHDVPRVKPGQKATFTVDAFPKQEWEGTVVQVRISPITQLKGLAAPSQLGAPTQTTIPGLQQQSGSGGAGSGAGSPGGGSSTSGGTTGSSSATGAAGSSAASVSPSTVPAATQAPGLVQYDALIEFRNSSGRLMPGMTAYVTIPVSAAYNVLRIRKETLSASPSIPLDRKNELLRGHGIQPGQSVVWVAEGGQFTPVAVSAGVTDYVFAQVTGNLQAGQRLLSGYRAPEKRD